MATLAGIDADVLQRSRLEVPELVLVLFAARRADHPSKWPRRKACRAQQLTAAAIDRGQLADFVQNRQLSDAATERTAIVGARLLAISRLDGRLGQPLTVRLQDGL